MRNHDLHAISFDLRTPRAGASTATRMWTPGRSIRALLVAVGVIVSCLGSPAWAAADPDLAAISAREVARTQMQSEFLHAWWSKGADLGPDFSRRVREQALADPEAIEIVELYVQVATKLGETARLHEDLEALRAEHPEDARYVYYLGLTSDQTEGEKLFHKALELDPEFAPALVALASLELTRPQANLAGVKDRLLRAARLQPDNYLTFLTLSRMYEQANDSESRVLALRRGMETDPESVRPRQALFEALDDSGKEAQQNGTGQEWSQQTVALLEDLGNALPGQSALLYTAARIRMSLNEPDRAFDDLQQAVAAGFHDPIAFQLDGALAPLRESGRLAPLIERATANRAAHEPELRRTLRAERLDLAAPDFELPRQGGGSVKLSDLRGKVVILDFWATWCGPCRKSLPALQTYYEKKQQNVEVFCVNVFERDGGRSVEPFWKQNGYPMPVLLGTQEVAQHYSVSSIPTLLVIGPEGRINYRHQGFDPNLPEQLHWMADALLDL